MSIEELKNLIETSIDTVYEIERYNLPRSNFAGIRNKKAIVKRTNNLRNNAWNIEKLDNEVKLKIDLGIAPYAAYINDDSRYITKGYFKKIYDDIYTRLKNDLEDL